MVRAGVRRCSTSRRQRVIRDRQLRWWQSDRSRQLSTFPSSASCLTTHRRVAVAFWSRSALVIGITVLRTGRSRQIPRPPRWSEQLMSLPQFGSASHAVTASSCASVSDVRPIHQLGDNGEKSRDLPPACGEVDPKILLALQRPAGTSHRWSARSPTPTGQGNRHVQTRPTRFALC